MLSAKRPKISDSKVPMTRKQSDYLDLIANLFLKCGERSTFALHLSDAEWVDICERIVETTYDAMEGVYSQDIVLSRSSVLPLLSAARRKFDLLFVREFVDEISEDVINLVTSNNESQIIKILLNDQNITPTIANCEIASNKYYECIICNRILGVDIINDNINIAHLGCGHNLCEYCWDQYIRHASLKASTIFCIKCPGSINCDRYITPKIVLEMNINSKTKEFYFDAVKNCFIINSCLVYCPNTRCSELLCTSIKKEITCPECNSTFDRKCRCGAVVNHSPLNCSEYRNFIRFVEEEDRNARLTLRNEAFAAFDAIVYPDRFNVNTVLLERVLQRLEPRLGLASATYVRERYDMYLHANEAYLQHQDEVYYTQQRLLQPNYNGYNNGNRRMYNDYGNGYSLNDSIYDDQSEGIKECPHCCISIEKMGCCRHMTCTCGHEFCWVCLKKWSVPHTSEQSASCDVQMATIRQQVQDRHRIAQLERNHTATATATAALAEPGPDVGTDLGIGICNDIGIARLARLTRIRARFTERTRQGHDQALAVPGTDYCTGPDPGSVTGIDTPTSEDSGTNRTITSMSMSMSMSMSIPVDYFPMEDSCLSEVSNMTCCMDISENDMDMISIDNDIHSSCGNNSNSNSNTNITTTAITTDNTNTNTNLNNISIVMNIDNNNAIHSLVMESEQSAYLGFRHIMADRQIWNTIRTFLVNTTMSLLSSISNSLSLHSLCTSSSTTTTEGVTALRTLAMITSLENNEHIEHQVEVQFNSSTEENNVVNGNTTITTTGNTTHQQQHQSDVHPPGFEHPLPAVPAELQFVIPPLPVVAPRPFVNNAEAQGIFRKAYDANRRKMPYEIASAIEKNGGDEIISSAWKDANEAIKWSRAFHFNSTCLNQANNTFVNHKITTKNTNTINSTRDNSLSSLGGLTTILIIDIERLETRCAAEYTAMVYLIYTAVAMHFLSHQLLTHWLLHLFDARSVLLSSIPTALLLSFCLFLATILRVRTRVVGTSVAVSYSLGYATLPGHSILAWNCLARLPQPLTLGCDRLLFLPSVFFSEEAAVDSQCWSAIVLLLSCPTLHLLV
eukprot:gene3718-7388_t